MYFIYATIDPHLKKFRNQTQSKSGTYKQIVSRLEKELELNGSETLDELQLYTVKQHATKSNPEKLKPTCHHCEKSSHYQKQWRQLRKEKNQTETNNNSAVKNNNSNNNSAQTNSNTVTKKLPGMAMLTKQTTETTENQEIPTHHLGTVAKWTTPQRKGIFKPMQQTDCLPGMDDRWNRARFNNKTHRTIQLQFSRRQPKL